jgi:hypothetical protein
LIQKVSNLVVSLLTLKGSRSSCSVGVEVVDDVDDKFESPWYAQRIHDLSLEGWVVDSIEAYLEEDVELASERIVYVDFAVDLAQELLERTGYLGESVNARSMEQSDVWERELRDPMNAERVLDEYNAWAKEWRPWELELNRGLLAWRDAEMEEDYASYLARFDALDASSLPSARILSPLLSEPEETEEIHRVLTGIEDDERRQRSAIRNAAEMLSNAGFNVGQVEKMSIIEGLDWITQLHEFHDVHEELRLLILEQIGVFDPGLAQHHETRRKELLSENSHPELRNFRLQMDAIADNLHQRLARLNDLLNEWRERGIVFPHGDSVRPPELLEWETNLPEIEATLELHLQALNRWKAITQAWQDERSSGAQYAGVLEQTEQFIDHVDHLDQKWKQYELEALMFVEKYEQMGLAMGDWSDEIQRNPRSAVQQLKKNQHRFEMRFECVEKLANIDTSFEGKVEIDARIELLKEMDVDLEILEHTEELIGKMARRGARHRRMLEQDWRQLVTEGKAQDSMVTSNLSLAEFEREIGHVRRFGTSSSSSRTGGSIVAGEVHQRLIRRTQQELAVLQSAGWNVHQLLIDVESNPVDVAQKLNAFRPYIEAYPRQSRRLDHLPWHRDIALALEIQLQLRDPTQLNSIFGSIASFAQHLASRKNEDEKFVFDAWTPQPSRQTLVPVPEHAALQTMVPKDALGDAYEAILEAMEEETAVEEVEEEAMSNAAPEKTISEEEKKIDSLEDSESTENEVVILDSVEEPNEITVQTPVEKVTELPAEKRKPSNENKSVEVAVEIEPKISDAPVPNTVYKNIVEFLRSINLNDYADDMELNGGDSLPNVRRGLAKHVGVTPRDTRIDRMLRLALRLLPQNNEFDEKKSELLALMAGNVKTMQRWMRARLEHRHSGSSDHFLEDARQLGVALKRIPGPGYPVPLVADDYDLPNANDIKALESEVRRLIRHLNLPTAGGITA